MEQVNDQVHTTCDSGGKQRRLHWPWASRGVLNEQKTFESFNIVENLRLSLIKIYPVYMSKRQERL